MIASNQVEDALREAMAARSTTHDNDERIERADARLRDVLGGRTIRLLELTPPTT